MLGSVSTPTGFYMPKDFAMLAIKNIERKIAKEPGIVSIKIDHMILMVYAKIVPINKEKLTRPTKKKLGNASTKVLLIIAKDSANHAGQKISISKNLQPSASLTSSICTTNRVAVTIWRPIGNKLRISCLANLQTSAKGHTRST